MKNRYKYDDNYDDGMGMDELIGRHLKNFAERTSAPAAVRQQIMVRAQDQTVPPSIWVWFSAYLRTIGRLLWLVISLRWLEEGGQEERLNWTDTYMTDDFALNPWFYRRTTMNSFLFGSGNFTLSG